MSARTKIIERWRTRLADSQQRVVECPAHRRWIHQICARVYSFLISCYGVGDWRTDGDADRGLDADASRMGFVDNTRGEPGNRPKSAECIRATLDAVHDAQENPPKPGRRSGLEFSDWVAVASETSLVSPRRLVRLLRLNEIESRQVRRGDDVIVEVFAGRREEAMELLERHRPELKIQPRHVRREKALDNVATRVCLGGFIGIVVGFLPMLLLMLVLDAVLQPRLSSVGGRIFSTVILIGWGSFMFAGAIVAIWRYYNKGV